MSSARDERFLHVIGERLRTLRARRGMTRRALSAGAAVSERYIAQLESGAGNISILLLRRVAQALGVAIADLVSDQPDRPVDLMLAEQALARLDAAQLAEARLLLAARFGPADAAARQARVALVGLRGAGKSTLGAMLAAHRGVAFFELDREVERDAGMELRDIFEVYGQQGFRRLEFAALHRLIGAGEPCVIAAGGGIVAEVATYEALLAGCRTVWVRAAPEEHMRRVAEQGDLRPMQDNAQAMDDLRAILASREALYAKADLCLDTAGRTVAESFAELVALLEARPSV
jgi:XRE family aerobic/anaerobic benzoate catabolism transcriptional regulator